MYPVTTVLPSLKVVNSVMKLKPELSATAVHHSEFDGTEVALVDGTEVALVDGTEVVVVDGTEVALLDGTEVALDDGTEVALDDGTEVVLVDGTEDVPGEVFVTGVKVDGVFDLLGRNILIFF
jgi:hypothetical protein